MKMVSLISSLYFLIVSCDSTLPKTTSPEQQPVDSSLVTPQQPAKDSADKNTNTESLHDADYGIYHMAASLNNKGENVYLKVHTPEKKVYIYKDKEEKQLIQSAPLPEDIDFTEEYLQGRLESSITSEDFNFDGYRDLLVSRIKGMKSIWYDIYLYDEDNSKFTKNDKLSDLESPAADPSKKLINYYAYGGMAGGSYVKGIYEWAGKQLTETRKEEQTVEDAETEKFLRTVYVPNENKELKPASRVAIYFDKKMDKEIHCLLEGDWTEHLKTEPIFTDDMNKVLKKKAVNGECN